MTMTSDITNCPEFESCVHSSINRFYHITFSISIFRVAAEGVHLSVSIIIVLGSSLLPPQIDVHQSPELKKALGVRAVPTVKLHAGSLGQVASFTCGPKKVQFERCTLALLTYINLIERSLSSTLYCVSRFWGRQFVRVTAKACLVFESVP